VICEYQIISSWWDFLD